MTITPAQMYAMLRRLEPWHSDGTDWRNNGKSVVRFVNWRKLAERRRSGHA